MRHINPGFCISIFLLLNFVQSIQSKYSSKTAYLDRFSPNQLTYINDVSNYKIENCQAEQIYLFLRHGARTPSSSQVVKSKDFLDTYARFRRGQKSKASTLDDVEVTFAETPYSSLTELGSNEMKSIAARFKQRYPHLFDSTQAAVNIDVLSSHKNRSLDSAYSFISGLYNDSNDLQVVETLSKRVRFNSTIMRLFDECGKYMNGVKKNKSASIELIKFENRPEMRQLISDFIERHDINDMVFKTSVIRKLFTLCTIEMAHRMKNNWCRIFKKEDYEILGYYNDLKSYWLKSYGHDINSRIALLLYKDLFENIDHFINKRKRSHKVLLRFGHAENMIPMLATLGLFRDSDHLRADNFNENLNRKFRTGLFSPFSANLAFVLHKCDGEEKYKMHVLVNELPVDVIEGGRLACDAMDADEHESFCELDNFRAQFDEIIKEDHEKFCATDHDRINSKIEL